MTPMAFIIINGLSWLWTLFLALPAWLLWSHCGLGVRYFGFLPTAWQSPSMLDMVALFLLVTIGRSVLWPTRVSLQP